VVRKEPMGPVKGRRGGGN